MGAEDIRSALGTHDIVGTSMEVATVGGNPHGQEMCWNAEFQTPRTVKVIVKDLAAKPKFFVELPVVRTVADLYAAVAEKTRYPADAFELGLADGSAVLDEGYQTRSLQELMVDGAGMLKMVLSRAVAYEGSSFDSVFNVDIQDQEPIFGGSTSWKGGAAVGFGGSAGMSGQSRFVGLSNQGATCYMNSLLQTLYMTPEFRDGVYKIPVEPARDRQDESICFQLQALFASMQLSGKSSVETKDLTKSFGWTGGSTHVAPRVADLLPRVLRRIADETRADLV